ncbi:NAD(P)/FAD-dependent oxidoreductase [Azospirillum canadense]|uniref:NAD(P)/FAD-dependent oxidoreductase n=1 Tax=Azospirillum canadense TaxID=403962 RepID=UPI0022280449|nr:FAD-dependent oxidoreductase [Azospirillum canadense]MCW2238100.1 NADPH-dependent 2,4-dienoyl-CoA reductase/sulfur reductase-like enzyme [Azospirillum canadense]
MHYVVLGAGPSGVVAAETLRKADPTGTITLVSGENEPPYSRMAIPYVLTGKIGEAGTHLRKGEDHYAARGIDVRVNARATSLMPDHKRIDFADGSHMKYDRLLVATGARPVRPPIPGLNLNGVHHCWTLEDARNIIKLAEPGTHVVLMGAGFIGCIVLEALAARGVQLTVVEMGDRMVPRMMNPIAGTMIRRWCEAKGIRVLTNTKIKALQNVAAEKSRGIFGFLKRRAPTEARDTLDVELDSGEMLSAHLVVVSAGVAPNVDFLANSGVKVDRGIMVDRYMRTSVNDVFAAGDVAQGYDFSTKAHDVHAIQPTASEHGRIAAMNMAGHNIQYNGSLQMNVLDTVGLISSSFGLWAGVNGGDSVEIVDDANYKYLNLQFADDVLVGGTAIGVTQHVGVMRGLIQTGTKLGPWKERLKADPHRLMEAYIARTHLT